MDMVFDFDQRQGLANVGFHGLDGTESVTSIKDALRLLKIRNPAVNFANAIEALSIFNVQYQMDEPQQP